MNLFRFGWLRCLAQPYFHIYFNKQCRVGTRRRACWAYTPSAYLLPNVAPLEGGVGGMPATAPSVLKKGQSCGARTGCCGAGDELVCDCSYLKKRGRHAKSN